MTLQLVVVTLDHQFSSGLSGFVGGIEIIAPINPISPINPKEAVWP